MTFFWRVYEVTQSGRSSTKCSGAYVAEIKHNELDERVLLSYADRGDIAKLFHAFR